MRTRKVIIVEDEAPLARALSLKLEKTGFDVVVVPNGEEFLSEFDEKEFDLIILDLMMPLVDGFKVLEWLKERENIIPVFVLSNLGQTDDIVKAKELGADEYFVKSNTPLKDIIDSVENVFNRKVKIKVK